MEGHRLLMDAGMHPTAGPGRPALYDLIGKEKVDAIASRIAS